MIALNKIKPKNTKNKCSGKRGDISKNPNENI